MTAVNLKLESGGVTATTQSSNSDSSFNWLYLVIIGLIVAAGAGLMVSRRSKTA
jgi:LPXTG-motif cell wall-anchored protein